MGFEILSVKEKEHSSGYHSFLRTISWRGNFRGMFFFFIQLDFGFRLMKYFQRNCNYASSGCSGYHSQGCFVRVMGLCPGAHIFPRSPKRELAISNKFSLIVASFQGISKARRCSVDRIVNIEKERISNRLSEY